MQTPKWSNWQVPEGDFILLFMMNLPSVFGVYALTFIQMGSKVWQRRWHLFILHDTVMDTYKRESRQSGQI